MVHQHLSTVSPGGHRPRRIAGSTSSRRQSRTREMPRHSSRPRAGSPSGWRRRQHRPRGKPRQGRPSMTPRRRRHRSPQELWLFEYFRCKQPRPPPRTRTLDRRIGTRCRQPDTRSQLRSQLRQDPRRLRPAQFLTGHRRRNLLRLSSNRGPPSGSQLVARRVLGCYQQKMLQSQRWTRHLKLRLPPSSGLLRPSLRGFRRRSARWGRSSGRDWQLRTQADSRPNPAVPSTAHAKRTSPCPGRSNGRGGTGGPSGPSARPAKSNSFAWLPLALRCSPYTS